MVWLTNKQARIGQPRHKRKSVESEKGSHLNHVSVTKGNIATHPELLDGKNATVSRAKTNGGSFLPQQQRDQCDCIVDGDSGDEPKNNELPPTGSRQTVNERVQWARLRYQRGKIGL
jgi:hypothetical protein